MILYVDTSVLLKLYILEPDSYSVRAALSSADSLASSLVTYAESRAGLARALRGMRLNPEEYERALANFANDWTNVIPLDVDHALVRMAGDMAQQYALKGFDAIHLASAVAFQRALDEPVHFSAADERLVAAAAAEGLQT